MSRNLQTEASGVADDPAPRVRPVRDGRGRFMNPWPVEGGTARGFGDLLRWQWERIRDGVEPHPPRSAFAVAQPDLRRPLRHDDLRVTWVGHATFLIEVAGVTLLTDPVWSERASPFRRMGPRRLVPAAVPFEELPRIDAVLLSHDHYDHLDSWTVRQLADRFPRLQWIAPLGYRAWLGRRGATKIYELDWWDRVGLDVNPDIHVTSTPAQHWTKRTPFDERVRLWSSFVIDAGDAGSVYFGGDSGYFADVRLIGERLGPFRLSILPIGAYEPRWFMRPAHMNPDEAVRTWLDLGGTGTFAGMHWGTFRLTDEPAFEPPERLRSLWAGHSLPTACLWVPVHGESRIIDR